MKKTFKFKIIIAVCSLVYMQSTAQVRSWTKDGGLSQNQLSGLGKAWDHDVEAFDDMAGFGGIASGEATNVAVVALAPLNSCPSQLSCYYSNAIIVNNFNYHFPSNVNVTITGVQVKVFGWASDASSIKDLQVQLTHNNTDIGVNKKKNSYWGTSYAGRTYGGTNDLWGASLTPAMIADPSFGIKFSVQNRNASNTRYFALDWAYLVVNYTVTNLVTPRLSVNQTGIQSPQNKSDFDIHPNPVNNVLSIMANKDLDNFEVEGFNVEGQSIFKKSAMDMKENESLEIEVADLPSGIYLLHIVSNGVSYTQKFLKQ